MVVAAALLSFALGLAACARMFRRATRDLRRRRPGAAFTWRTWQRADPVGGVFAPVVAVGSLVAATVGFYGGMFGFVAPGWLRAALLGFLAGFCLPAFLFGVHLKLKDLRSGSRPTSS
ncbi:hypothetical protein DVA67_017105 [Solirubrobacter sp. CPCC 204708]|uniref:SdpI family protein n=1 Tax=Solirubrobacter deserti TaxID=2282478 RepID=A0ABT4RJD6_9ACTN|nr:hypothetical protein [Solirubrobacter deserti]MBE2317703.1 hypothetical protein [Solirubrobacter deserti]MDA0138654.1 hypothetical protein [Solirubrobacter deserti]